ncbi:hypothetical protein BGX27_010884 [Mortierella sp. AM989]|nr:hypothetical protein BGX27_010884 [Mortierella sp. AM989]
MASLPTISEAHFLHLKRKFTSNFGRRVLSACVLSLTILGFYSSYTWIAIDKSVNHLGRTSRPNCPILENLDTCVHYKTNITGVVELCGSISASIGDCQDRVYDQILTTKDFIEEVSEHATQRIAVQAVDIGAELDSFVQTRSRWSIDLMGRKGYELLISFKDHDRLTLHKELDQLQHRCNRFFYGSIYPFGFGSSYHNLGLALAYGMYYDMTLFTPIEHKYFIRTTTCTEADLQRSFSAHPPVTEYNDWDSSTINYKSMDVDVEPLMRKRTIISSKYKRKGHLWWRSMLTYYGIRPNFSLRELIRQAPSTAFSTPCISIHVRHSDKVNEATLIDLSKYMEHAYRYRAKTGVSTIYILTDDDQVINSTKDYSEFQFHYMDMARSNKGWQADTNDGIPRDEQEKLFLIDVFSAARCEHNIVTYSSNVGRLIGEMSYAIRNKKPDVVSLDVEWMMDP